MNAFTPRHRGREPQQERQQHALVEAALQQVVEVSGAFARKAYVEFVAEVTTYFCVILNALAVFSDWMSLSSSPSCASAFRLCVFLPSCASATAADVLLPQIEELWTVVKLLVIKFMLAAVFEVCRLLVVFVLGSFSFSSHPDSAQRTRSTHSRTTLDCC